MRRGTLEGIRIGTLAHVRASAFTYQFFLPYPVPMASPFTLTSRCTIVLTYARGA
jgi:hypothetical protein